MLTFILRKEKRKEKIGIVTGGLSGTNFSQKGSINAFIYLRICEGFMYEHSLAIF